MKEAKFDRSKPFAFMHIAKAGGTALHAAFGRAFNLPDAPHHLDRSNFACYDDFSSWHPDARKRMIFLPESGGLNNSAPYVAGHISLSTIRGNFPDAQIVTVLREPMSRLLSSWVFGRVSHDRASNYQGTWGERLAAISLDDLLSDPQLAGAVDNWVTRTLLCPHPLIPDDGFIAPHHDAELIEQALGLLESFSVVALYEDENYISLFEKFLGVDLRIDKENETHPVRSNISHLHTEIESQTFELLKNRCRVDEKIWEAYCYKYNIDFNHVRMVNLLKNTARFSLVLSGFDTLLRERDLLRERVRELDQILGTLVDGSTKLMQVALQIGREKL